MKALGIVAILGGLLIIIMKVAGAGGIRASLPHIIVGAVIAVVGILLVSRTRGKRA